VPRRLADIVELSDWIQPLHGVRAIFAFDVDGSTTGELGSSRGVSDGDDRTVLLTTRRLSDVALTGGATARAEAYKPSSVVEIAIVTRDAASIAEVPAVASPGLKGTRVFVASDASEALEKAVSTFRDEGKTRILFEGGINLLAAATSVGFIDEILVSSLTGPAEIPDLNTYFNQGWRLLASANFGTRWLFKLGRPL